MDDHTLYFDTGVLTRLETVFAPGKPVWLCDDCKGKVGHPFVRYEKAFEECVIDDDGRCVHPAPWDESDGKRAFNSMTGLWVCRSCTRVAVTGEQARFFIKEEDAQMEELCKDCGGLVGHPHADTCPRRGVRNVDEH